MDDALRTLQMVQLEILKVIDTICKKYEIPYSLYAGSLLGAVRHQGFIPWDDDLDICMLREYYVQFLQVWQRENPKGYVLQNKENEPDFTQSFSKIRKDHTTFLQHTWEAGKYHTGIFVDIFPIDRIPNGVIARRYFWWNCMKYQLFTREFAPPKASRCTRYISQLLLLLTPRRKRSAIRQKTLGKITQYSQKKELKIVGIETIESMHRIYPANLLDKYTPLLFEDSTIMVIEQWEKWLKSTYGDYMQFPPESERTWTHHPIILNFEYNLDEL